MGAGAGAFAGVYTRHDVGALFTRSYLFCLNFARQKTPNGDARHIQGWGFSMALFRKRGIARDSGLFSNLRFRSKIMLGFAAVLGISVLSMATADLGFDR